MKTKYALFLKLIGSLFALVLLLAPSLGTAFTITQIDVVVGGVHYCDTTTACGNQIWNLNGGVTLADGQTLIVTQTGLFGAEPRGGENFDTSDRGGGPDPLLTCSTNGGSKCSVQIFINSGDGNGLHLVNSDDGSADPLSAKNNEPTSDSTTAAAFLFMEAAPWVPAPNFTGTNYTLDLGYADNVHGSACPDSNTDCFPQPVWCSTGGAMPVSCPAADFFLGQGVNQPIGNCGQVQTPGVGVEHQPTDKNGDVVGCYDAGALRITAHPPQLAVVKSPKHGTFTSGSQLTYTVVVSNNATNGSVAHNVKLNDQLPSNGGLLWSTASASNGGTCTISAANLLHCDLGDIAAGAGNSVMVTIKSTTTTPAPACQDQPNPAAIATDNEGDRAQDSGDQTCIPPPHLTVVKTPKSGTFASGSQLTYTVVVSNNGAAGSVAHNVLLDDVLPGNGGLVWQTASATQGGCTNPIVSNTLHCALLDIAAGASVRVTITSTATTPAAACQDQPNPAANATDNEGDTATDHGDQSCTPSTGKSIAIGPSSMEGAITIDNGDWVNGGYSFKTNFTGTISVAASVSITGPCSNGGSGTLTFPLPATTYNVVAGSDWIPTGDQNSILSWQGSAIASVCGGVGSLNANKGAVFNATVSGVPTGGKVTFRFKYRDPAAKGKPNTNCLNASDPNRNKADVCGASWSETKTDP